MDLLQYLYSKMKGAKEPFVPLIEKGDSCFLRVTFLILIFLIL